MNKPMITLATLATSLAAQQPDLSGGADNFYHSDQVDTREVTFPSQYQTKIAGNLHVPVDIEVISPRPMLFITGETAHSREFSEEAHRLAAEPKELLVVPGAGHVDLYDRVELIPFDELAGFFSRSLEPRPAATSSIR